jgi:hypothetical protein
LLIGGITAGRKVLSSCELLLADKAECQTVSQLNFARAYHAAASCADSVYVFGGRKNGDSDDDSPCVAEVEQYNWYTRKWTVLDARLSVPRYVLVAVLVKGAVYLLGGRINEKPWSEPLMTELFDVKSSNIKTVELNGFWTPGYSTVKINATTVRKLQSQQSQNKHQNSTIRETSHVSKVLTNCSAVVLIITLAD